MQRTGLTFIRCLLLSALLVLSPCLPALAQQQAPVVPGRAPNQSEVAPATPGAVDADLPLWQRTLYKTLTYQAAANVADVVVFDMLVGTAAAVSTGFFVANATTAAATYYGFEYAWQNLAPTLEETTERTLAEKVILFRFIGVGRNFALGYIFGGGPVTGTAYAAANLFYDTAIFTTNEYVWDVMRPQKTP